MGVSGELDRSSFMKFYRWNRICYLVRLIKSIKACRSNSKFMKQIQG